MQYKIKESAIEKFAIELLEKQGYQYIYASDIAPVVLTDLQMDDPDIHVTRNAESRILRDLCFAPTRNSPPFSIDFLSSYM